MRYDVRVSKGSRFDFERDEPLKVGDLIRQFSMVYQVTRIQPLGIEESEDFDAVAEVEWRAGPGQAEYTP